MTWVAAALGGLIGTLARHAMNVAFARHAQPVPYATAAVNIIGSFIIGALAGSIAGGRLLLPAPLRVFIFVGLLGGFTTFSSYMLDTFTLANGGSPGLAAANIVGQTVFGLAATLIGYRIFS